ncbi:BTAD domain-containing putative transcriptional regulator [Streptomyces sp. 769]|uniref:BTAD domain-containing putative transcriptional regulator n=1 Tax=Streptomyces sp. 769 TaxID=1262452 RepID=UPI00058239EB|nr:BTAD domain-containing putative transcriptional regulator [Streptomyces sp. 769]AJC61996.1 putative large membrane protein [Streptomyces sp. 769]
MTPPPARRSWPLTVARILGSLIALVSLVVGLPLALLQVGTLPSSLPSPGDIGDALTAADDSGQALFTVITLICWALWAWFLASLVVEAAALLRHRRAPRLRGMAAPQRLAAVLLGGLLVLPPATALAATPATAAPTATVAASATQVSAASQATVPQQQSPAHTGRTHRVGATGETVWDIAEQYLGDGRRHTELRALNPHLPQSATLPAGTIVNLPSDAAVRTELAAATPAATETHGARHETKADPYTVATGDSLSGIAHEKYGNANRWHDIYAKNKATIHDPDLIYPGQHLDLPRQQVTPAPPSKDSKHNQEPAPGHERHTPETKGGTKAAPPHEHQQHGEGSEAKPTPPAPNASAGKPGGQQGHTVAPSRKPAADDRDPAEPSAPHSPAKATPAPHRPARAVASNQVSPGQIAAIGGGVLAAALLSTLATRRILQQRRRHRGRRIALPKDGAAATEQDLRTAEAALDTTMLDGALRTAAVHLTAAERELPPLSAAVIGPREIVLHLTEPAAPVPPFSAAPDALQRWTCPTRGGELLPQGQTDDVESPYPTLASLGWDEQGHLILLDLENAGHLHLTGADRHRVLRTLALELAASEFADHLTVCAVGQSAPGLREELPERVIEHADIASALGALRAHHAEQQRALAVLGAPGLRRARTGEETAAAWSPHLLFSDADDGAGAEFEELRQVVAEYPRSATVLVTTGSGAAVPSGAQVVEADTAAGPVTLQLPGTEVEVSCNVQALSDEDYAYALEVLATTRADDVPAAQPVVTTPKAVPDLPQYTAATDESEALSVAPPVAPASSPAHVPGLMAQFALYEDEPPTEEGDDADAAVGDTGDQGDESLPLPAGGMDESTPSGSSAAAAQHRGPAVHAHVALMKGTQQPSPEPEVVVEDTAGDGPVVRMLGPVDIVGARGSIESKRQRTCIELAAWLVLHPNLDHHAVDEAMWPGRETARKYRNATVSRLRTWLGTDEDDNPFFPPIATTSDARYALAPTVDSDWHHFQRLTTAAVTSPSAQAAAQLRAALELVRGRPFSGVNSRRYAWAEHQAQDMISAIVDAAADLAEHCLAQGDPRGALWAATKGLDAAPEMENLYRVLFRTYAALGDYDALERAAEKLDTLNMELGVDMEESTAEILAQLSKSA